MEKNNGAVGAIIVAAGKGNRMGLGYNKVLASVSKKPVIEWTLRAFVESGLIDSIVLVISPEDEEAMAGVCQSVIESMGLGGKIPATALTMVYGGTDRQDSVKNGLKALNERVGWVLVHDGARPFVDKSIIERSLSFARLYGAACAGMPVKDTIKMVDENHVIASTPDRNLLWSAQTPQAFSRDIILDAYEKASIQGVRGTDDAGLAEAAGYKVTMFEGSYRNIKLTSSEDLLFAEQLLGGFEG